MKAIAWTPEEDSILRSMTMDGKTYAEVADSLPGRTYAAVKCRMRLVSLTPAQLQESNRKKRARRVVPAQYRRWDEIKATHVPPELFEERDRRLAAPRSVTAWFCGDPAPGQSALDRRT